MQKLFLGLVLIALNLGSFAQINYTDIIPDIVLDGSDTCFIDIDADGADDLKFTQEDSISTLNANGIGVTLLHNNIEFIGDNPSYDPGHLYPFKVDSNNVIYTNADNRQWVVKLGGNDAVRVMHIHFFAGADIGEWAPALPNSYLGIRIKIATKWHYGWVRIGAPTTDASMLIIKDFALNMEEEEMIHAGQIKDFGPSAIAVSYEDSLCGTVVGFVRRNTSPTLKYNIIYKKTQGGTFDSIYAVSPNQAPYFLDLDPLIPIESDEYRISAVDLIKGESLLSDPIGSGFLYVDSTLSGNIRLGYHHYQGLALKNYSFIHRLDSMYQPSPFDSIISNDTSLIDTQNYWSKGVYNYIAKSVLQNPIMILGYGLMDTLKSNPSSNYAYQIINPIADFTTDMPAYGSAPVVVDFTDLSKAGITNWYWSFGDSSFSHSRNPSHLYTKPGVYDVKLIVSTCFGMDVIEKKTTINVGIRSTKSELKCRIFPNPSNGIVRVELSEDQLIKSVRIIDLMGKELFYKEGFQSSTYQLDLSYLATGIYYISVATKNQVVYKKLVIE